jgi:hypothetical protein
MVNFLRISLIVLGSCQEPLNGAHEDQVGSERPEIAKL